MEVKLTKKAFREYLNREYSDSPNWRGRRNRGQRTRGYGDYLYSADRVMFDVEYEEWREAPDTTWDTLTLDAGLCPDRVRVRPDSTNREVM